MIVFIDENKAEFGVEPICRELPIARRRTTSPETRRPRPERS